MPAASRFRAMSCHVSTRDKTFWRSPENAWFKSQLGRIFKTNNLDSKIAKTPVPRKSSSASILVPVFRAGSSFLVALKKAGLAHVDVAVGQRWGDRLASFVSVGDYCTHHPSHHPLIYLGSGSRILLKESWGWVKVLFLQAAHGFCCSPASWRAEFVLLKSALLDSEVSLDEHGWEALYLAPCCRSSTIGAEDDWT